MTVKGFREYFDKKKGYDNDDLQLKDDVEYAKTVKEFYEECIEKHLKYYFCEENKNNLEKWCAFIEEITEQPEGGVPIYWIRKYESGKVINVDGNEKKRSEGAKKDNKSDTYTRRWDNRRGAVTIVANESGKPQYGYIYVSNFDAQEIYNMVLNISEPTSEEYFKMIFDGTYCLHYDNNGSCVESDIAFYEKYGHVRGGVLSDAGYYLAHINDVNGAYYNGSEKIGNDCIDDLYPLGSVGDWCVGEWKTISGMSEGERTICADAGFKVDSVQNNRIRVIHKRDETDFELEKRIMKAHFLRFIHPFNYFLVPAKKYSFNAVTGKSIGEYKPVIEYVKKQQKEFLKPNKTLNDCYENFYKSIMIAEEDTISEGNEKRNIHMLYGKKLSILKAEEKLDANNMQIVNISKLDSYVDTFVDQNEIIKYFHLTYEATGMEPYERNLWNTPNTVPYNKTTSYLIDRIIYYKPSCEEKVFVTVKLKDKKNKQK